MKFLFLMVLGFHGVAFANEGVGFVNADALKFSRQNDMRVEGADFRSPQDRVFCVRECVDWDASTGKCTSWELDCSEI